MTTSSEELGKHANSVHHVREDSEYVRLVISNETRTTEADMSQPQAKARIKSFLWWVKALIFCILIIIFLLIFLKWGVPFLFEKVLLIHSSFFLVFPHGTCYAAVNFLPCILEILPSGEFINM